MVRCLCIVLLCSAAACSATSDSTQNNDLPEMYRQEVAAQFALGRAKEWLSVAENRPFVLRHVEECLKRLEENGVRVVIPTENEKLDISASITFDMIGGGFSNPLAEAEKCPRVKLHVGRQR